MSGLVAALALAEHYFPTKDDESSAFVVDLGQAAGLLSGRFPAAWRGWPSLPYADKQRVGRMLRHRAPELASYSRMREQVAELLAHDDDNLIKACYRTGQMDASGRLLTLVPVHGQAPLEVADRALDQAERAQRGAAKVRVAGNGRWQASLGGRAIQVDFTAEGKPRYDPPQFTTQAACLDLMVDLDALLLTASLMDSILPGPAYRHRQLHVLLTVAMGYREGGHCTVNLRAGALLHLSAPTGAGKNVLAEVLSVHLAVRGHTVTFVVGENDDVYVEAAIIDKALAKLSGQGDMPRLRCTPFTSPHGRHEFTLKSVKADNDGVPLSLLGSKVLDRIDQAGYGCPVSDMVEVKPGIRGGQEPCRTWVRPGLPPDVPNPRHLCRYVQDCGKFDQITAAATASVIVTNHAFLLSGRISVPVSIDGVIRSSISAQELLLRISHQVTIDEVDQFQAAGFTQNTKQAVLADHSNRTTVLRDLEADMDHVAPAVSLAFRRPVTRMKYLAEQFLDLVAESVIRPEPHEARLLAAGKDARAVARTRQYRQHWYQASRYDRDLLELLIGVDPDSQADAAQREELTALMPATAVRPKDRVPLDRLRPALRPVRRLLEDMLSLDEREGSQAESHASAIKEQLRECLLAVLQENFPFDEEAYGDDKEFWAENLPDDRAEHERWLEIQTAGALHSLMMKTWLSTLQRCVFELARKADELRESGLRSAHKLADETGLYDGATVIPYGPLGHLIIGFRIDGIEDPSGRPRLTLEMLRGDPHIHTAYLGDVVALAAAGHQRAVLGMSATGFLPRAAATHLIVPPTWWMCDDNAGRIDFFASTPQRNGSSIAVGGTRLSEREDNVYDLAFAWAPELAVSLARLRADPATRHRAHGLVATNSYVQDRIFAHGLHEGLVREGISMSIFAAESDDPGVTAKLPRIPEQIGRITRDRFVDLVALDGDVMVAPLSRCARCLNVLAEGSDGRRESAIGLIALAIRPVMPLDSPADMAANIAGHVYRHLQPDDNLARAPRHARALAIERIQLLLGSPKRFTALHPDLKCDLVATVVGNITQLAGRGRRGQTDVEFHFLDGAFHDTSWGSDLPALLRMLYESYTEDELLRTGAIHGRTAESFLQYAAASSDLITRLNQGRSLTSTGAGHF
ncbi:hypothetical protein ACWFR1_21735 [Streptomyces sp. NPDC055103]